MWTPAPSRPFTLPGLAAGSTVHLRRRAAGSTPAGYESTAVVPAVDSPLLTESMPEADLSTFVYSGAWQGSQAASGYSDNSRRVLEEPAGRVDGYIGFYFRASGAEDEGFDLFAVRGTAAWYITRDAEPEQYVDMAQDSRTEPGYSVRGLAAGLHKFTVRVAYPGYGDSYTAYFDGITRYRRLTQPTAPPELDYDDTRLYMARFAAAASGAPSAASPDPAAVNRMVKYLYHQNLWANVLTIAAPWMGWINADAAGTLFSQMVRLGPPTAGHLINAPDGAVAERVLPGDDGGKTAFGGGSAFIVNFSNPSVSTPPKTTVLLRYVVTALDWKNQMMGGGSTLGFSTSPTSAGMLGSGGQFPLQGGQWSTTAFRFGNESGLNNVVHNGIGYGASNYVSGSDYGVRVYTDKVSQLLLIAGTLTDQQIADLTVLMAGNELP